MTNEKRVHNIQDAIAWPQDVFAAMDKARGTQSRRSWLIQAVQAYIKSKKEVKP